VVRGQLTEARARQRTTIETRQFAKRQKNWFNKEPAVLRIEDGADPEEVLARLYARRNAEVEPAR
jgi:tRNA A37 N6-isopentenylltransferase MiaA